MSFLRSWKCGGFRSAVVALTAALVFGSAERAPAQQYYYQPSPNYYHNDTVTGTVAGGALAR